MKNVYPVILTENNDGYIAEIPDFDIMTQGKSLADAIDMARDAISITGIDMQDDKKDIPKPSNISEIHSDNGIVTLVDVDFEAYRRMTENRSVRKNCTLPAWLCAKAEQENINFSQTLQEALTEKLHLNNV